MYRQDAVIDTQLHLSHVLYLLILLFSAPLHYQLYCIVISISKMHDRDWSYTRQVICINNQCCSMQQHPGEHDSCSRGTWREEYLAMHLWLIFGPSAIYTCYIRQIKYIFCAAFVDFVSYDVTVVSSLKRYKKSFVVFWHIEEFKNVKII